MPLSKLTLGVHLRQGRRERLPLRDAEPKSASRPPDVEDGHISSLLVLAVLIVKVDERAAWDYNPLSFSGLEGLVMHRLRMRLTVTGLVILIGAVAFTQTQPGMHQFDVISVKPRAKDLLPLAPSCRGDRFRERGLPIYYLMRWAYRLPTPRIQGLPPWANDSIYDIEAKAPAAVGDSQCRVMVQSLLESRFKMTTHWERKEIPAYALTVGSKGPKMRLATPDDTNDFITNGEPFRRSPADTESEKGLSMERLAFFLSSFVVIGRPVVDRTGLKGRYVVRLNYAYRDDEDLPSIWVAIQEQLGLRLESAKGPVEILLIDHVERPSEN